MLLLSVIEVCMALKLFQFIIKSTSENSMVTSVICFDRFDVCMFLQVIAENNPLVLGIRDTETVVVCVLLMNRQHFVCCACVQLVRRMQ